MSLEGTTQRLVSKLTGKNKAPNGIRNWTPTPMETHGIHYFEIFKNIYRIQVQKEMVEMVK